MTNALQGVDTTRSMSLMFRERTQLVGAVLLAVVVPFLVRFDLNASVRPWDQIDTSLLVLIAVIGAHAFLKSIARYPSPDPISSVLPAVSASFAGVLILITAGHLEYSRSLLAAGFIVTVMWYSGLAVLRARAVRPRFAVVPLGTAPEVTQVGNADWRVLHDPTGHIPAGAIDGVVADLGAKIDAHWEAFIIRCATQGIPIYDSTLTREFMTGEVNLIHAGDIGIDALHPQRNYLHVKFVIDVILALILLPPVLLLLGAVSVLIKLDSPGPALFVQRRVGYRGREFDCYKLRSMSTNAHLLGPGFTTSDDPRVTRIGRFIRKYRIDEMPQIFNILRGEMSWIGPRPEAAHLAREYERHISFYAFRHSVRPGITGWAAIRQGNVADVAQATRKLRNDFFYIKNISASLDAFIALKTIRIVLSGFGSR